MQRAAQAHGDDDAFKAPADCPLLYILHILLDSRQAQLLCVRRQTCMGDALLVLIRLLGKVR